MKQKDKLFPTLYRFWASKWRDGEFWTLDALVDRFRNHATLRQYNLYRVEQVITKTMYIVRRAARANGEDFDILVGSRGAGHKILAYKKGNPNNPEDISRFVEEAKFQLKGIAQRVVVHEQMKESGRRKNLLPPAQEEQLVLGLLE